MGGGVTSGEPRFTNDPYFAVDFQIFPTDALAGIEVDADGAIERFTSTGNQGDIGRWDNGLGTLNKADYQFRLDTISGSVEVGSDPVDTWLAASAGLNFWRVREQGIGTERFTGTLRVRLAVSPFTEYDTASVNPLEASSEP
jgi:hypothetical protein